MSSSNINQPDENKDVEPENVVEEELESQRVLENKVIYKGVYECDLIFSKGQQISKAIYGILNSSKNELNSLSWASSLLRIVSSVRFLEELKTP